MTEKLTIPRMLRPHWMAVTVIVAIQIVGVYLQAETISLLKPILDISVEGEYFDSILIMAMYLIFLTLIVSVILMVASYLASKVASAVSEELRMRIMSAAVNTNDLVTAGESTTNTMTCLTNDVNSVQRYLFESLRTYLPMPFLMGMFFIYTMDINLTIGLIMLFTMLGAAAFSYLMSMRVHPLYPKQVAAVDAVNKSLREKMGGSRTIHAYNAEDYETEKFSVFSANLGSYNRKVAVNSYYIPHISTAFLWLFIVLIFVAIIVDESGKIVPTEMVLFMQYVTYIVATFAIVPYLAVGMPRARVCFKRIRNTVTAEDADRVYEPVQKEESDVMFLAEGVTITDKTGRMSVTDLDLSIDAGETITILGPNGCGASDIFKAAMGFKRYGKGRILIDGMDPSKVDPSEIRSIVAYASNSMHVLRGTLRYNLDPHGLHTDGEILDICDRIGLGRLITSMPEGLDTAISNDISSMSGGQKLLVIMARCLLHDAKLYVFDDCFFSLDPDTRAMALKTIMDVCKGRTVVFLMHDMSTASVSKDILLMHNGRIVDRGTDKELLDRSELYRNLHKAGEGRYGSWA